MTDRRRWLLSFLLLSVITTCWGLLTPLNSGPDEHAHLLRAAGVAGGQWLGPRVDTVRGPIATVQAPLAYNRPDVANPCVIFHPEVTGSCLRPWGAGGGDVLQASAAGRYPPLYYALVGWPTRLLPDAAGARLARVVSGLLLSALLAAAIAVAAGSRLRAGLLPALAVATTPTVVYLGGLINPSGLEIGAAVLLWTTGLVLVADPDHADAGPLVLRCAVLGAVLLALARPSGPLVLVLVLLVLATQCPRPRRRALLRQRPVRVGAAVVAAATVAAVAYTVLVVPNDTRYALVPRMETSTGEALQGSLSMLHVVLSQTVGSFGFNESSAPLPVLVLWPLLLAAVLAVALAPRVPRRRALVGVGLTALVTLAYQLAVQLPTYDAIGQGWQGRYDLPLTAGLALVAGAAVRPVSLPGPLERRASVLVVALAGAGQVVCLLHLWRRYSTSVVGPLNPLAGSWQPPVPGLVLTALVLAATVALGVLLVTAATAASAPSLAD